MDLLQNPFHILRVTPRDNRQRIIEMSEERSLLLDSRDCTQARSDLTNPRKRLSMEVAWLPGLGPKRATQALSLLDDSVSELLSMDMTSIARSNLLASVLTRLSTYTSDNVSEWILKLAFAFENIDPEEVRTVINEERIVSGFQEVTDLSIVEAEIQERRQYYRQVIKSALNNLSLWNKVVAITLTVESATDNGENHGPVLIDDLIDSYEVEAQPYLKKHFGKIEALVEKLRAAADAGEPDSTLAPIVRQLIEAVESWDIIAQPIQVSTKARGLDHDASHQVARLVREVGVHLINEHGKLDFAQQLINMLQEVFTEVVKISESTAKDISDLDELAKERLRRLVEEAKLQTETEGKISRSPQEIETVEIGKSEGVSGLKWVLGVIGVIFLFWLATNGGESTINTSSNPPSPNTMPKTSQSMNLHYEKPPVGTNLELSVPKIRWCVRERIRIDATRDLIHSEDSGKEFNKIVDDYNRRCGSFRYQTGSLERAQREVEANRSQIVATAIRTVPKGPSPQLIREAQSLLTTMGYDPGPVDGLFGRRTADAVKLFQKSTGLPQNGWIDKDLLISLQECSIICVED